MARLPVDPQFGKVLLASAGMGCCVEAMQLVAMVSADNIFFAPRDKRDAANAARLKFTSRDGDHLTLLNVMRAFLQLPRKQRYGWATDNFINLRSVTKAVDIYEQLQRHVGQLGLEARSCGDNFDAVRRALVAGLFHHAARRTPDGTYRVIASGQQVWLHPSSTLLGKKPEVVVFSELVRTTKQYAREATAVDLAWLPELVPGFFAASKAKEGAGEALS
jgi:ATP-dependent RNA helicase DHX8/PRP22